MENKPERNPNIGCIKRPGGELNYQGEWVVLEESTQKATKTGEKLWVHACGAVIMGAKVDHPIWDKTSPCAGGGATIIETVPVCGDCETEPQSFGAPIYSDEHSII